MIMVRGACYPIIRLHELYKVKSARELFNEGILIMVEDAEKTVCLFADELLGEQQVVVKPLPALIKNIKEIKGLSGCTLLGDGSISLILDTRELISGLKA
jgi:two-component system chemotaxis sensor kinase CheA